MPAHIPSCVADSQSSREGRECIFSSPTGWGWTAMDRVRASSSVMLRGSAGFPTPVLYVVSGIEVGYS